MWKQIYNPAHNIFISALIALIPLIVLFYLLAIKRKSGHFSAIISLIVALIIAVLVWKMPILLAINSTIMGMIFGLFPIIWIIINAIWLYNMTVQSGQFEIIKKSLSKVSDDRRLQAIFIAFAFGAFMEGTAGFGTPVAITTAMLVGLGFVPIYAARICLLANTAPVAFGSIGIPLIVAAEVSKVDIYSISSIAGVQIAIVSLIIPLWLIIVMCGLKKSFEIIHFLLFTGFIYAAVVFLVSNYIGPYTPDLLASLTTIVALLIFIKYVKPKSTFHFKEETKDVSTNKIQLSAFIILKAWLPYIILALLVFIWSLMPIKSFLNTLDLKISWPYLDNMILKSPPISPTNTIYSAKYNFTWASASGTAIFIACLISVIFMPSFGYFKAFKCFLKTFKMLIYPIITTSTILGFAYLMNYSGMSSTIGIALTSTGVFFPFFSPVLGWLGVFLTGSDTSSNALFCSLQATTAKQLGLDQVLAVAANSTGGMCGKMISPQSIAVGAAASGLVGKEGEIFKFTFKHSLIMVLIIAIINFIISLIL
jgi:lactate permease